VNAVRVGEGFIEVHGEKIPLLACEFHYWRNKQEYWRDILQKIKDAGFTVVTSFVQPNLHEYEPGKFDFEGKTSPQRDVVKFLKLCKEVGLYAHLRPGPACCEWRESGGTFFGTNWLEFADQFVEAVKGEQVTSPHTGSQ